MITVDVGGGKIVEFPDGTSQEEMQAYIDQNHPVQSKDPLGLNPPGPTRKAAAALRVAQMSPLRKAVYGAERSLDEPAMGLKQLTVGLTPEDESELGIRRSMEQQIPGSWASRMVGDMALYAAPTTKALALANKLRSGKAAYAAAAGTGAGIGAIQPTLGDESRSDNAISGGAFGLIGQGGGDIVAGMIKGVAKNPSVSKLPQAIRDRLSLGQSVDRNTVGGKILSATEEKLQSVPIAGSIIRNKREGAVDAWRDDLVEGVAPAGFKPTGIGTRERIDSIHGEYAKRYAAALRNQQVPPSQLFESQVAKITNNPRSGLTRQQQAEMRDMVMDYYNSMFHGNNIPTGPAGTGVVTQGGHRGTPISIDADNAKGFEAFLTGKASQFRKSNAPGSADMAKMFDDLERAWSVSYRRALPSSSRKAIKELDQSYAPYKTVERAASYVGNDFGDFTPQQLVTAIRSRTPANKFARGQGILQDEGQAARDVLIDRTPNSGTADRALTFGMLTGLVTNPMETLATMGVAVPAMTTKTGKNLVLGDTKTQKLLQALRADKAAKLLGAPTGAALNDLANEEFVE